MSIAEGISGTPLPRFLMRARPAHRQTGSALRKSMEMYNRLASKIRVGLFTVRCKVNGALTFECVSPRTAEILGLRTGDLLADTSTVLRVIHKADLQSFVSSIQEGIQKPQPISWNGRVSVAGALKWLHLETAPEPTANGDTLWHGLVVDITERKRMEAEMAGLEAQTRQLQKSESLGRMAGSIAHHFNNKLQTVMANLELLASLPKGADPARYLASAMESTDKAAEVSRLLLVYLGQSMGQREPRLLSSLCKNSLIDIQKTLPGNVTLATDLPSPGPVIQADAHQIRQILTQLVTNARESMGESGGSIHVGLRPCPGRDVPASHRFPAGWEPQGQDYFCLDVTDTGRGIEYEDIEKLFDPFFSTKFTGRGLGLSVVLGLVQAHGGGLTVASLPGQGSVFRVHLPVSTEALPSLSEQGVVAPEFMGGGTLLLVDDDDMLLMATGAMVELLGFTLLTAKDGVEALELYRQHRAEIRCVLTDLTMPRLDGWGLVTALRQFDPSLPVILASGYDKAQVLGGTHPDRPQAFLSKPFSQQQLRDALGVALVTSNSAGL